MSDQELKEKICGVLGIYPEEIQHVLSVGIGENKINGIIEIFHSHMQTAFDDVLGNNLEIRKPEHTIVVPLEQLAYNAAFAINTRVEEQRERAKLWLGGDK